METISTIEKFLKLMAFENDSYSLKGEIAFWSKTLKNWYKDGLINFIDDFEKINALPNGLSVLGNLSGRTQDINKEIINYKELVSGDVINYFNFDKSFIKVPVNLLPYASSEIIEDNQEYTISKNEFGAVVKTNKESMSYMVLEQKIKTEKDFEKFKEETTTNVKKRFVSDFNKYIKEFKNRDFVLIMGGWPIGVFSFGREVLGFTNYLMTFYDNPKFIKNILNFMSNFLIEIISNVLNLIDIDVYYYWEDMAFKNGPLLSPKLFYEFLSPVYKKINSVLKDFNVKNIWVDSDGDIKELIPLWIETGITGILPMEVQAGMDIVEVRKKYPDLQITGGIDKKQILKGKNEIDRELEKVPFMLESGGYIPTFDHSVPPDISWENFKYYRQNLNGLIDRHYKR
ncbi:MAG: hypothetical protein M1479_07610 [Actinobacteria bacterium]|nr:hypothetical protein [Actinomycetota bacterium]